ncbi:MAG: acyltransferase [Chroococcidiopsidaceae cyanobacterium CP_BM_RX_35]|nr:acyltransferase [Chroococcidiopsidaceae cyanobacterium CP_BM_RX_35]
MRSSIPTKLEYIDGLKVIMILCVLLTHLPEYLEAEFSPHFWQTWPEWGGAGVSGFVILSGFGLTYSLLTKNAADVKVIPFFWKRFTRLIPLYYIALFAYLLIVDFIQPMNLLAHLIFIHTFFQDFSHNPGSLWFVGLIVQCYLFFPLAYKLLFQKKGLFILNVFAISLYALGIMLASRGLYIRDSFLSFSVEFVLGMNIARDAYMRRMTKYSTFSVVTLVIILLTCFIILAQISLLYSLSEYIRYPITTFSRICFFFVVLNIFLFIEQHWKYFQRLVPLLSALSFASYSVFLFHRPMLTIITRGPVWNWIVHHISTGNIRFISLFIVSIPLIFLISFWMQIAYDSIQKKLLTHRVQG